jgi:hypothetical protein
LGLIAVADPDFELIRDLLLLLNDYAVDFRYPGAAATKDEARAAVKAMRTVRAFVYATSYQCHNRCQSASSTHGLR